MRLSYEAASAWRRLVAHCRGDDGAPFASRTHDYVAIVYSCQSAAIVAKFRELLEQTVAIATLSNRANAGRPSPVLWREFRLADTLASSERTAQVRAAKLVVVLAAQLTAADIRLWGHAILSANTAVVLLRQPCRERRGSLCGGVQQAHTVVAWRELERAARCAALTYQRRSFSVHWCATALATALAEARGEHVATVCDRTWQQLYALHSGKEVRFAGVADSFAHPFGCGRGAGESTAVVTGARHVHTFRSQAAPKLLELLNEAGEPCGRVVAKAGDDLSLDAAVLAMLRLLNEVWRRFEVHWVWRDAESARVIGRALVQHRTYRVAPRRNSRTGFVELLHGASVRDTRNRNWSDALAPLVRYAAVSNDYSAHEAGGDEYCRSLASVVALGVAGFVLGIRDRHEENILRLAESGEYVNIDLQWCFGDGPLLDTAWFPLMQGMRASLEHNGHWTRLKQLCVQALCVLRPHAPLLCSFARALAPDNARRSAWPAFVAQQLAVSNEELERLLEWGTVRKKPKDWMHELTNDGFAAFCKRRFW